MYVIAALRYMYLYYYTHWKKTYPMKCWWVHLGKHSIWVLPCLLTTSSILLLAQHQIIEGQPTPSFKNDAKSLEKQNTQLAWTTPHTIVILCNRKKNDGLVIFTYIYIATAWLCYFWHLDFFFFLSQLFIDVLSQNIPHPNPKTI